MISARFSSFAFACAALAVVSRTRADGASVDDLLRRGVALRREHRNEEALAVFERVVAIAPTPPARAQLALAEQALGRWLPAERDLDAALSATSDAWIAKNRGALEGARAVVLGHLGWVTVTVDAAGAAVTLDGAPVVSGAETRVVVGEISIDVRADGRVAAHRTVSIAPADHALVAIEMPPAVSSASSPTGVDRSSPLRVPVASAPRHNAASELGVPITLEALGLAAFATGTYFGIRALDFKSARDGACAGGCLPVAATYDSDARSSAIASDVAFGVGVGLVAAGAVWWLVGRERALAPNPAVEVVPIAGGGVGGLLLRGHL